MYIPDTITLAHGAGGRLTRELIEEVILPYFDNPVLNRLEDAATLPAPDGSLAFTTDSYVVNPLVYPGGDIGRLSICGTVNDLAVSGAQPLAISLSLIIEEGLPFSTLRSVLASMRNAAIESGVRIVTGDTKVVAKNDADGLYVTTTGIGVAREPRPSLERIRAGDAVILSGSVGNHGAAVMLARGEFKLEASIKSDNAPLTGMLLPVVDRVNFMRDPTRGGLATTLNEIATGAGCGITIEESLIPVQENVRSFCEILGIDPLHAANEGIAVIVAPRESAAEVVEKLRAHPLGREAALIGKITAAHPGRVHLTTRAGGERILDLPSGLLLPRIC